MSSSSFGKKRTTPVAHGVSLSDREIDSLLQLRKMAERVKWDLFDLADQAGVKLRIPGVWMNENPSANGFVFNEEIWMRLSDTFTNLLTFAEEYHLLCFAPDLISGKIPNVELGYWKGKSRTYAAVFMYPTLPEDCTTVEDIYRLFTPEQRTHAHARFLHFQKQGW